MDLATVIGLIGSFGIVIAAMVVGGDVLVFVNVPSLLIVLLGSLMVVMMKFGLGQFLGSFKIALKAFIFKLETPDELIEKTVELSQTARKNGLLALESVEISNDFYKTGIQYLVDGVDPEMIRSTLVKEMNQTVERHDMGQQIFIALADVAPAMGMIGTLVGLVQMLSAMDDPKSIGPAMAVALLTTLYGAVIANMVASPISDKLSLRNGEERLNKSLIIDGVMGIQAGQNPRVIEELLKTYLPVSKRAAEPKEDSE